MLTKQKLLILLLSLTVITPALAKVYKWTDANGKLHYTSTPPPTSIKAKDSKELKIHKTPKSSLTYKHTYKPPVKKAHVSSKPKVKKTVRKKEISAKNECESTSIAEREAMMRDVEKNGKKLVANGRETNDSYNEKVEMFRRAIIDCEE